MLTLTIRRQMLGSALLSLLGFVVFGIIAYTTLQELKIAGPRYKKIAQGKDLIADVVPPPEFLVEAFLAVHQMIDEGDRRRLEDLIQQSQQFRANFEERHEYWSKTLQPGPDAGSDERPLLPARGGVLPGARRGVHSGGAPRVIAIPRGRSPTRRSRRSTNSTGRPCSRWCI